MSSDRKRRSRSWCVPIFVVHGPGGALCQFTPRELEYPLCRRMKPLSAFARRHTRDRCKRRLKAALGCDDELFEEMTRDAAIAGLIMVYALNDFVALQALGHFMIPIYVLKGTEAFRSLLFKCECWYVSAYCNNAFKVPESALQFVLIDCCSGGIAPRSILRLLSYNCSFESDAAKCCFHRNAVIQHVDATLLHIKRRAPIVYWRRQSNAPQDVKRFGLEPVPDKLLSWSRKMQPEQCVVLR